MKNMEKMVALLAPLTLLLSGCGIGTIQTLFVTKTNGGLEISSEPPTVALDISRQEGVIAPQFENGQKLPVMASFKFDKTSYYNFEVGSAFAAGDAALVMAALYNQNNPIINWDNNGELTATVNSTTIPVDSSLTLKHEPKTRSWSNRFKNWFSECEPDQIVHESAEVKPVFFGTDTTLGIKAAWTGATGTMPDKLTLGYNRKEFALLPIAVKKESDDNYKVKMSSLLATVDSDTSAGEKLSLDESYIQYFATGKSATLLALQKDVRMAMLKKMNPELFGTSFPSINDRALRTMLVVIHQQVRSADLVSIYPEAKNHHKNLDEFANGFGIPKSFKDKDFIYIGNTSNTNIFTMQTDYNSYMHSEDVFVNLINYWGALERSRNALSTVKSINDKSSILFKECTGDSCTDKTLTNAEKDTLLNEQYDKQVKELNELEQKVRTNATVIAAYRYFTDLLSPK